MDEFRYTRMNTSVGSILRIIVIINDSFWNTGYSVMKTSAPPEYRYVQGNSIKGFYIVLQSDDNEIT